MGERIVVPCEAPEGRRVNAIGAVFTHGPDTGRFEYQTLAKLSGRGRSPEPPTEQVAGEHGLGVHEVGVIDGERFVAFAWVLAGRPANAPADWKRERPLHVVLDNYSVHKGQQVKAAQPMLEAAGVHLFYLPAYAPELSRIEPVWHDVKYHHMPKRSYVRLGDLKRAVEAGLASKAEQLRRTLSEAANKLRLSA